MELPVVIGISGASGVIYGIETLRVLSQLGVETHLILTHAGETNIEIETNYSVKQVKEMASVIYEPGEMTASIASGSFLTRGMLVAPCTIKTLSGIANSYNSNLLVRGEQSRRQRESLGDFRTHNSPRKGIPHDDKHNSASL